MIAAIYARKSTDQIGVADEDKSVARQVQHARAYAQRNGWTVDEASIFVDDGISGAEFAARPGFVRLMNALAPRPRFQVLIMSEESRLGREMIKTAYALQQILNAGVRVFFYLEDRERTLAGSTEKVMMALRGFADELEREKASLRVHDAMRRKFDRRHVLGGQCFGYRNVDVMAPGHDGRPKRQFVRREIDEREAAIVRRIFELCAAGAGLKGITKTLNAERARSPRSQQGRPHAWAPSSVRAILYRESYRGQAVWNKSRKRNHDGEKRQHGRPVTDWLRAPAEELRIVSDTLWHRAHDRLAGRRASYRDARAGEATQACDGRGARLGYLLSGFARCAVCGGSMQAVSRPSTCEGQPIRVFRYVCGNYVNRGSEVCANERMARMDLADAAIRELLAREVLRPAVLERALDVAVEMLRTESHPDTQKRRRAELQKRLRDLEGELTNLADLAARGGAVPVILEALTSKDAERRALVTELERLQPDARSTVRALDARHLRRQLRAFVDQWQDVTAANVPETRELLNVALRERIVFRPIEHDGTSMYELMVPLHFERVLRTAVPDLSRVGGTSPKGLAPEGRHVGGLFRLAA